MSRLVILGHTGFIGGALQVHFQRKPEYEVVGFSSRTVDLRRRETLQALEHAVDRSSIVISTSAITRDKGDTFSTFLDNITMAGNLGAFLEEHPPAKCIFFSSDAVYPMQDDAITEQTPVSPGGALYAIAKYTAECVLRRSAEAKGIPLLVLRPTGVFGPGDGHNSYGPNAFLRSIARDRSVRLFGQGEEQRDHLCIGDLVALVDRLVESDAVGVLNLASGVSPTFADVVVGLRRSVPIEFSVIHQPRSAPITHRRFDISRLLRQVPGFTFTALEDALHEAFTHMMTPSERM